MERKSNKESSKYNDQELYEELEKAILENDLTKIKIIIKNNSNYKKLNYNKELLIKAIKQSSNNSIIEYFISNEVDLNYEVLSGNTPLFEALNKHNYYLVDELLKRGADINYSNAKGYNVLLYLKESNCTCLTGELFRFLLKRNIDLSFKSKKNKTFLECLIEEENLKMLEIFISNVIFSNDIIIQFIVSSRNKIPISRKALNSIIKKEKEKLEIKKRTMDTIISKNNSELLKIILKYKMNILNENSINDMLLNSCKAKNIEYLKLLIEKGADVNYRETNTLITPLMSLSIINKNLKIKHMNAVIYEMFKLLIDAGAYINERDVDGKTALMYILSTKKASTKLVKLLVKHGAKINDFDYKSNNSPLIYACIGNNRYVLKFLLESGADTSIVTKDGNQLIFHATMNECIFLTQYLIENKLVNDLNCVDANFETPLMHAVRKKNIILIKYLLDNGADINYINDKCESALSKLLSSDRVSKKLIKCLEILIDYGANLNNIYYITQNNGLTYSRETPLINMVNRRKLNMVELLINKGADVNGKDLKGATPLYYAVKINNCKIVKFLFDNGAKIDNSNIEINRKLLSYSFLSYRLLRLLIKQGFEINDYIVNAKAKFNNYLLSIATTSSKMMSIRFLLANNANPYQNNFRKFLPFQEVILGYQNNKFENSKKIIECYESFGVDIKKINENGEDLLNCVVIYSYNMDFIESMTKYLVEEKNMDINTKNNNNITFLMNLMNKNNLKIEFIKYLVEEHNCDINSVDCNGNNALMYALYYGNSTIYNYLLDKCQNFNHKNNQGTNLLMLSVKSAELDTIERLIENGISINEVDNEGRNALFYVYNEINIEASRKYKRSFFYGNKFIKFRNYKYLIDQGINLNCIDKEGKNSIFYINDVEVVKYSVEHGMDITHRDNEGCTILFNTTNTEIMKYAISQGVDASLRDVNGHTAIYKLKPINGFKNICKDNILYLLEHGADIKDYQFSCGNSYYFYYNYNADDIFQLINLGFDFDCVNVLDNENNDEVKETFLDYFIANYHRYDIMNFVNILKTAINKNLFNVNRKNFLGDTPLVNLMKTLSENAFRDEKLYHDLITSMVDYGADLEICGMEGKAPLYYALMFSSSLVKTLYSKGARTLYCHGEIKTLINIENVIMHDKCDDSIKCEIIEYLEDIQQANINEKINGSYIIFLAIEQKCYNVVKYLISKNVSLSHTNNKNETVMDVAKRINDISITNLISRQKRQKY
ncbi:ankyrin [Piromyces finnis]|uniref:Ankyrin n=1 Tax=Piromyces finnis TaxID=1754191 RepID=A0A1Y1VL08_9FUNG|nr:ankyrin [Piromyces finnis]|eukprot:ORX57786.1 ankyrin [Piromyces finnis]